MGKGMELQLGDCRSCLGSPIPPSGTKHTGMVGLGLILGLGTSPRLLFMIGPHYPSPMVISALDPHSLSQSHR